MGSGVNIDILNVIRHEPSSPREVARFLSRDETDVSRRLRLMQDAGIVRGAWTRKMGRNIKLYSLLGFHAEVDFSPGGLKLHLKTATDFESRASAIAGFDIPIVSGFVGRRRELDLLSSRDGLHVIVGLPGIGKTSLAAAFAATALKSRPVMWHTTREVDSLGYIANRVAVFLARFGFSDALDYATGGRDDDDRIKIELVGKGLDRIGAVVIFDDYHRRRDERLDALLEHLWRRCNGVKLLVLSRSRPTFYSLGQRVYELWLNGLTLEETEQFLSNRGVEAGRSSTPKLWHKVAGHPLSLTLFCSLAKAKGARIQTDAVESERITDYFLREVYSEVGADEQDLLITLSIFRTPVTAKVISEIFHLKRVTQLVHRLEMRSLVTRRQDTFAIHDLLRDAFYKFFDDPAEAHLQVARYFAKQDAPEKILEAIFHFIEAGDTKSVLSIIRKEIESEAYRFVENGWSAPLLSTLKGLGEPPSDEDSFYVLCIAGKAKSRLGEWSSASQDLTKALQKAERIGERRLTAYATKCLAEHYYWRGDFENTMRRLLKASELFKSEGMLDSLQRVYSQLARLSFSIGRHDEAEHFAELAEESSAGNVLSRRRNGGSRNR